MSSITPGIPLRGALIACNSKQTLLTTSGLICLLILRPRELPPVRPMQRTQTPRAFIACWFYNNLQQDLRERRLTCPTSPTSEQTHLNSVRTFSASLVGGWQAVPVQR